jgi:hypothetical protein
VCCMKGVRCIFTCIMRDCACVSLKTRLRGQLYAPLFFVEDMCVIWIV